MIQDTAIEASSSNEIAAPIVFQDEALGTPPDAAAMTTPAAMVPVDPGPGFTFRGVKLHPFNAARASLFLQHRLAMGAPSLQAAVADVDAFLGDALKILWLCSHVPEDWARLRCSPPDFQLVLDEWADEDPALDPVAAVLLGLQIYAESRASAH